MHKYMGDRIKEAGMTEMVLVRFVRGMYCVCRSYKLVVPFSLSVT